MKALIAFILVFNNIAASTQEMGFSLYSKPDKDQDSTYLRNYGNFFVPAVYTIRHFSKFSTHDKLNKTILYYQPNINLGVGLCASYKWMGIAGSAVFGFLNNDDLRYGKTKKTDFYTNLYSKKFLYDITFQYYHGYYINNPKVVDSTWKTGEVSPQRPDINTATIGIAVYYIMNYNHFSLKAPYNYCDEQLHSAGSFILGGFTSLYGMWSDINASIVPAHVPFQDSARYSALNSFNFGFSGGYAYTWVFKKHWFLSGMLLPGLSLQSFEGTTSDLGKLPAKSSVAFKSQIRFSFGYSRPRFYAGWVVVVDAFSVNSSKTYEYKYTSGYTCLTVGTRILPPKHRKISVVK